LQGYSLTIPLYNHRREKRLFALALIQIPTNCHRKRVHRKWLKSTAPPAPQVNHISSESSTSKESPVPAPVKPAQSVSSTIAPSTSLINRPLVRANENGSADKLSSSGHEHSDTGHVMVLGEVGSPHFIHRELPKYPYMARKLGKEGKVVLRLTLDAQGQLQAVETVEASGFGFAEAANTAIRMSTYAPAVKNGRAISSQVLVPVKFVLQ